MSNSSSCLVRAECCALIAEVVFKSGPPVLATIIGCGQPGIEPLEQLPILWAQAGGRPADARCRRLGLLLAHGGCIRHEVPSIQMIAQTPEIACITAPHGYFRRLNPAGESTRGHTRDELKAKRLFGIVNLDDVGATQKATITKMSRS